MKTKLIKALILMLLVSVVFFAVSCGVQKPTSESTQSESLVESTLDSTQSESLVESNTEESEPTHVCEYTELKFNSTHHWYECICGEKDNSTEQEHAGGEATCQDLAECTTCGQSYGELGDHNYVNKVCSVCGEQQPSQGLRYELSSDSTYYKVIGIGTCADKDLIIPSAYNNLPVKEIGYRAFDSCSSLTSLVIGDGVTTIGEGAFYYCDSLTSIEVDVNNIAYASVDSNLYNKDCSTLIQYAIGKEDSEFVVSNSVTTIGDMAFSGCDSLTSVVIPNSVTTIGERAFYNCSSLTSVEIPDSVTTIGEEAFRNLDSLTSVVIPDSVTTIGSSAFSSCDNLTSVYYTGDIEGWCNITFSIYDSNPLQNGANLYINNELVTELVIPNTVTEIKDQAFAGCSSLTSVEIPDSVLSIGNFAFLRCYSLTSVVIGDSVTTIGSHAFSLCTSLTSVVIPDSVVTLGYGTFSLCDSLTSVVIGDSVTTIDNYAFETCTSLTSVVIGDSVTTIGEGAFWSCHSLKSIKCRGTEEQWLAISKGSSWNFFTGDYTITYNYQGE